MAQVVMLVHESNGWYGASFPDFPGCTAVEADLDALVAKATEVLPWHVSGMVEDGDPIPKIRSLSELRADPEFREAAADAVIVGFISVDLPGKSVRVNITMDELVLETVDHAAKAMGESRSGFLAKAAIKLAKGLQAPPNDLPSRAPSFSGRDPLPSRKGAAAPKAASGGRKKRTG